MPQAIPKKILTTDTTAINATKVNDDQLIIRIFIFLYCFLFNRLKLILSGGLFHIELIHQGAFLIRMYILFLGILNSGW